MNMKAGLSASILLAALASQATPAAETARTTAPAGATLVGGALPGGAILSARSVLLQPAAGGAAIAVPLAADGSFTATGLVPGSYQAKVSSTTVGKQTQTQSFGEKVQSGLQQAGSALAQGAAKSGINRVDSTPARISTNFTVGRQTQLAVVDGDAVSVTVPADGRLEGNVKLP